MLRVKICGITNERDARYAVQYGADALGFIFAKSPRKADEAVARKISRLAGASVATVGVFVDEPFERMLRVAGRCSLRMVQLHGAESERVIRRLQKNGFQVIKALKANVPEDLKRARDTAADAILFDTAAAGRFGGTGKTFDWNTLKDRNFALPWFVSGGLDPKNIRRLLSVLSPYGVDVSSGVESAPGKKNAKMVKEFIQNAKRAR